MKKDYFFLAALLLAGCDGKIDADSIAGIYVYEDDHVMQTIQIERDFSYTNVAYQDGEKLWSDRSNWEIDRIVDDEGISFESFRFAMPNHSELSGYWFVVPEKSLVGQIKLCFDPDLNLCFVRRS